MLCDTVEETKFIIHKNFSKGNFSHNANMLRLYESNDSYLVTMWISRESTTFNFEASVSVFCEPFTALENVDYECNETRIEWREHEHFSFPFAVKINHDVLWEHDEVFYVKLKDPFNGKIHRSESDVSLVIVKNDAIACNDSFDWTIWNECNVSYGTGTQTRTRRAVVRSATHESTCEMISESRLCQRDDSGLPPQITISNDTIVLLEDDWDFKKGTVLYQLGGMPQIEKYKNKLKENQWIAGDQCVVQADIAYDESLDVEPNVTRLCWKETEWAHQIPIQFTVYGNNEIDDENPRKRFFGLTTYVCIAEMQYTVSLHFWNAM